MGSYILNVLQFVNHEELREDGHCLEPNTERPEEIHRVEGFMDYY